MRLGHQGVHVVNSAAAAAIFPPAAPFTCVASIAQDVLSTRVRGPALRRGSRLASQLGRRHPVDHCPPIPLWASLVFRQALMGERLPVGLPPEVRQRPLCALRANLKARVGPVRETLRGAGVCIPPSLKVHLVCRLALWLERQLGNGLKGPPLLPAKHEI